MPTVINKRIILKAALSDFFFFFFDSKRVQQGNSTQPWETDFSCYV